MHVRPILRCQLHHVVKPTSIQSMIFRSKHSGCTENYRPKPAGRVNLPNCDLLSLVLDPLDSFKYGEIEVRIRREVENHHPKVLS